MNRKKGGIGIKSHARNLFWNAMLLTATSLLVRTVGVWFGVVLSNRAGAEAMGLFSLMGGVYGFALTLATSGIHLGVTRVLISALGSGKDNRVPVVMRRAVLYALCFGLGAAALLIGFAPAIGLYWIKDARTIRSLRLFGVTLPLIAVSSAFGGYFTAVRRAYRSAVTQMAEQGVKIAVTMYLLPIFLPGGTEDTLCAMVLGGAVAETGSFLLELFFYLRDAAKHYPKRSREAGTEGRQLVRVTLPIAVAAYLRSGLLTLEHLLIPEGLRNSGASHAAALIAYGTVHSMAMPVILYPAALIASFSGLVVPEVAESCVRKQKRRTDYMISRVFALSMLFSVGVAGILICFSGEIGNALYPGTEAGTYIRRIAPLIPIMYVDTATDALLKGLGEQLYSMKVNIADALLSVILVRILTPRFGIAGYLITIYVSETFNTVLSIGRLLRAGGMSVSLFKWVWKPLLSIVGATSSVHGVLCLIGSDAHGAGAIVLHCTAVLAVYFLLLILTGSVNREDLEWVRTLMKKDPDSPAK